MNQYEPRADVLETLHGKTLVMIVGPTSVGKSSVMNQAVRYDSAFARVSGLTTREPRPDDEPGLYRYVSEGEAEKLIKKRKLVQYVIHPTTGKLYGTEAKDFAGFYNLQDTLSTSVDFYKSLPFARHVTVSLTTDPETCKIWLIERYPAGTPERKTRLQEARSSIQWSMAQTGDHHWLVNRRGELATTAANLVAIARGENSSQSFVPETEGLLRTIADLLSYE